MADKAPPQRYRVIERGGRLEVIDTHIGQRPPGAAERMAEHDRAHGFAAQRYARAETATAPAPIPTMTSGHQSLPTRVEHPEPLRRALSGLIKTPSPATPSAPKVATPLRQTGSSSVVKPFTSSKWWDSKGPRTITLSRRARETMSSDMMTFFGIAAVALLILFFISPVVVFVLFFVMLRFGGTSVIGKIGARIIDRAEQAERTSL